MGKKIAVLVRDRQGEALRMGLGITLMDDTIDIYVLDREVEENEENIINLEAMEGYEMNLYTNHKGNGIFKYLSDEEIAQKLLEYDHILPY
jgi:hypothetical protein